MKKALIIANMLFASATVFGMSEIDLVEKKARQKMSWGQVLECEPTDVLEKRESLGEIIITDKTVSCDIDELDLFYDIAELAFIKKEDFLFPELKNLYITGHRCSSFPELTSFLSFLLSKLLKLEILKVAECKLTELPSEIYNLEDLRGLNLEGNKLKINDAIFGFSMLESIKLTEEIEGKKCDREYEEEEIAEIRKEKINDIQKKLRKIQDPIDRATMVKHLTLSKNKIAISKKDMGGHIEQDRKFEESKYANATAEERFLKELLLRLKKADRKFAKKAVKKSSE